MGKSFHVEILNVKCDLYNFHMILTQNQNWIFQDIFNTIKKFIRDILKIIWCYTNVMEDTF